MRTTFTCLMVLFCLVVAHADPPPREMAKKLGYSDPDLLKQLAREQGARAPRDPGYRPRDEGSGPAQFSPQESLTPQMYQRSESPHLLPYLIRLHQEQPQSAKITRRIALTCLRAGQPREALHWFTLTYHRDRSDLKALWNMASLAWRLGDRQAAHAYLREYAARDRDTAWGKLARDFLQSDDFAGIEMSSAFSHMAPRGGVMTAGAGGMPPSPLASDPRGLFVLQGKRVDPRSFEQTDDAPDPAVAVRAREAAPHARGTQRTPARAPVGQPLGKAFVVAPDEFPIASPATPATPIISVTPAPPVASPPAAPANPVPLSPGAESVATSAPPLLP